MESLLMLSCQVLYLLSKSNLLILGREGGRVINVAGNILVFLCLGSGTPFHLLQLSSYLPSWYS